MSARLCSDCGRLLGEDMQRPVNGHCYAAWFIDWQSTDCWRITSEAYRSPRPEPQPEGEGVKG